jgi:hypothetical protein
MIDIQSAENHASGQVKERLTPAGSTLRLTQP